LVLQKDVPGTFKDRINYYYLLVYCINGLIDDFLDVEPVKDNISIGEVVLNSS